MRLFRVFTTLVIGMVSLSACKPKAASKLKTLENFALNEDVRVNACSAPADQLDKRDPRNKVAAFVDVTDVALAKKLSAELILALSAVPDAAIKIFQARNGKVLITPNAAQYCNFNGAVRFKGKSPVFASCLVNIPFGSGTTTMEKGFEGLTLVSNPDAETIRHGTVRTMGYLIADVFAKDPGFSLLKVELTKAFLTDVASSQVFNLKAQEGLLGAGIDGIVRRNLAANAANPLTGAKASPEAVYNFMNFVVGEAFDSYYCRTGGDAFFETKTAKRIKQPSDAPLFAYLTDTRKVMEHFFPRTYSTFRLVEAHMEGYARTLPAVNYRGGVSSASSGNGLGLSGEDEDEDQGLGLDKTVGDRKKELEQQIREHSNVTREAAEQAQQKASNYNDSYTDVWGTKKSEMETARAVLNSTRFREQALLSELRKVEEEEVKAGAAAKTENDRQFAKQDIKVDTFDPNKELAKGVQEQAKIYGDASGRALGKAGEYVAGEQGKAFGEGLGDGIGGTLGAFGKNTTDAIDKIGKKTGEQIQFAKDLAVDPSATLKKAAEEKIKGVTDTVSEVGKFGGEVLTGDTTALGNRADKLLSDAPVVGTLYQTGKNVKDFATGDKEQQDKAIQAQYKTGGDAISNVQDALVAQGKKEFAQTGVGKQLGAIKDKIDDVNPIKQAEKYVGDKIDDVKDAAKRGVIGAIKDVKLQPPGTSDFSALKDATKNYKTLEKGYEKLKSGVETIEKSKAEEPKEGEKKEGDAPKTADAPKPEEGPKPEDAPKTDKPADTPAAAMEGLQGNPPAKPEETERPTPTGTEAIALESTSLISSNDTPISQQAEQTLGTDTPRTDPAAPDTSQADAAAAASRQQEADAAAAASQQQEADAAAAASQQQEADAAAAASQQQEADAAAAAEAEAQRARDAEAAAAASSSTSSDAPATE